MQASQESGIQKRQYYRLRYPRKARPYFKMQEEQFHVSEVSEKGIRVVLNQFSNFYRGLTITGVLNLHDGRTVMVQGSILRFDSDEMIIYLDRQGLSFKNMVEEQRFIRAKYPVYFARLRQQESLH